MAEPKRVVVLGGGYGGTYTFRKLHKHFRSDPTIKLTLVSRSNYFVSTPFLHEVATGGLDPEHVAEPLRKIFSGPEDLLVAEVESISLARRIIKTSEGEVPYDYLVIALGAETNYRNVPGAREHAFPLKTLEEAIRLKNHFLEMFERAAGEKDEERLAALLTFVVVGGGATGVELVAEMADFFRSTLAGYYDDRVMRQVRVMLISSGDELLVNFERSIRTRSKQVLRRKGIEVRFGVNVIEVRSGSCVLNTGEVVATDTLVWVAGVVPSGVNISPQVEKERGRIVINQYLQIPSFPEVFALGDIAAFRNPGTSEALPMLAQVAHRQSVAVARNIINLIENRPVVSYRYHHWGDLVSLGEWMAAGELFGIKMFGHFSWFFWRGVYLSKLLSLSKKISVLFDWIMNVFSPRDISAIR